MKKVLVIHNNYRNRGGEDIAVENEIIFLKKYFEVHELIFENSLTGIVSLLFSIIFGINFKSNKRLKKIIEEFNPDLAYVHNTWFTASLGIFKILKDKNIKTFIKLHNFRYRCTNVFTESRHLDGENFCPSCGFHKRKFGFFNKYFENSYIKSLLVIIYGKRYFRLLNDPYFKILVLTKFHEKIFKEIFSHRNVDVFPNFLQMHMSTSNQNKKYLVYAGRVSKEKGVEELIQAFLKSELEDYSLKIIGNGPLLKNLINKYQNRVDFLGQLPNEETITYIQNSSCVITATKLLEGQPTLLCEASSVGVPSIFPNFGGMLEFFPNNYEFLFKQYDYSDLILKLNNIKNFQNLEKFGNENQIYLSRYLNEEKLIAKFNILVNE